MKERGIICTDTVPALLDGTKTQSRRLLKPQPLPDAPIEAWNTDGHGWWYGMSRLATTGGLGVPETDLIRCPYGAPGDRLWVREGFALAPTCSNPLPDNEDDWHVVYRADDDGRPWQSSYGEDAVEVPAPWRSPMFMPRWASRILLELLEVRVQRIQEITEEDARAEGVVPGRIPADEYGPERIGYVLGQDDGRCTLYPTEQAAFAVAWDEMHGAGSWAANPWVWALTFKRVESKP